MGALLQRMQKGDVLIVSELSRLGRNLMQIMKILHDCMERDVMVYTVKENYELGNNINSKVLAFAFGLSAEIERNLISQRTKEALARRKAEGQILGRPKGSKSQMRKLTGKEEDIKSLMNKKISYSAIGKNSRRSPINCFFLRQRKNLISLLQGCCYRLFITAAALFLHFQQHNFSLRKKIY